MIDLVVALERAGRGAPPIGFAALVKVTPLPEVEHGRSRSLAVGTFDGVHLGHREVIRGRRHRAHLRPPSGFGGGPQHTPRLLTSPARKAELVASLGVQEMVVIPFDAEFAARPAEEFIDDVLVGALGARQVSVGENFRFGRRAQGDPELLRADPRFETVVHPLLEIDGEVVSSSHIRGLVLAGELEPGQPRCSAAPSSWRGRSCTATPAGASSASRPPTSPPTRSSCARATACTRAWPATDGLEPRPAAVSIGVRPTFNTGRGELIEAYILDFDGDLYGSELRLDFIARLRGERRFSDAASLVEQMRRDVLLTRELAERAGA